MRTLTSVSTFKPRAKETRRVIGPSGPVSIQSRGVACTGLVAVCPLGGQDERREGAPVIYLLGSGGVALAEAVLPGGFRWRVPAVLTRRTAAVCLALLAWVSTARPADASGGCIYIAKFGPGASLNCSPTTGTLGGGVIAILSCDTGAPTGSCTGGGAAANGLPLPWPGCYEPGEITIGPVIVDGCGASQDDPPACKAGGTTNDLRSSNAGLVGDPVDLRTGALSLDPVDVDLGNGLRFARHYSSKTTVQSTMGKSWSHSLDWKVMRATAQTYPVVIVKEPLRPAAAFATNGTDGYVTSPLNGGSVTVDGSNNVHYTSDTGVEADFDALNQLVALRHPGEPEITVSYGTNTTTPSATEPRPSLLSVYPTGHASAGLVSSVVANSEAWSYAYNSQKALTTVTAPDPSTPSPSDTVTWTYVYTAGVSNRIARIDRTTGAGTTTVASWTFGSGNRVVAADEPALEQALQFSYSTPQSGVLRTTVSNASSQTLALFDSDTAAAKGILTSVTNPTGPMAPLPGGPGVPVPFVAATTIGTTSRLTETQTDKNGNVTLYDDYDDHGHPQSIVEGWVDGPGAPGVFSVDDTWARWREYTYHPVLDDPLTITEASAIAGAPARVTTFDYDDPLAPGDNPSVPNEDPTSRVHARTEQGSTLDASGAVVAVAATTHFTYDAAGHVTSESGPRAENHTEHSYDTAGNHTATRRYLDGPSSAYLETTFSSFDARGNPQTVTDPNGRITTFTYDAVGRVKTVTPPYAGGGSTITSTYDVDGNLVRVDFPNDSFGQPYFVRLGYDTKNRLTFFADSAGNAIVYERIGGRVTREALYAGFVDLANRGTLKGDSTFGYDVAGRLLEAFNPLFGDNSIYSQYGHDGNGNQTSVSDENGKLDNLLYDALDRLTTVQQVRGGSTYTTGYAYDGLGNVKQVTDPAGKATDYQFDDLGRLVKVTSPNTGVTLYLYDAAGNLVTKKEDATGTPRTTLYEYDGLDRLTRIDFPSDADWLFTYDGSAALNQKGRLSSVGNGTVTTELEYTDRGEIAVERTLIGGGSYAVSYGYDATGNLTSLQTPSGVTTTYAYSAGRPKTVTVTAGSSQETIRNLKFLPFGPRTRAELPPYDVGSGANTVISTRTYNQRGQVSALEVTSPLGDVLDQSFTYGYIGGAPGPVDGGPNLDQVIDNRDSSQSPLLLLRRPRPALEEHESLRHAALHLRLRREREPHAAGRSGRHDDLQLPGEHRPHRAGDGRRRDALRARRLREPHLGGPDGVCGTALGPLRPGQSPGRGPGCLEPSRARAVHVRRRRTARAQGRRRRDHPLLLRLRRAPHRVAEPLDEPGHPAHVRLRRGRADGRRRPAFERITRLLVGPHRPARHAARGDEHAQLRLGEGDLARDVRALRARDAG